MLWNVEKAIFFHIINKASFIHTYLYIYKASFIYIFHIIKLPYDTHGKDTHLHIRRALTVPNVNVYFE